ncbi:CRISPR-associated protein [Desulforamulus profundi]|uniref:CRISPR-associated protein n=1 Tax=Desulforamulus profundi TaxID=1383067 RepID=A0A2C6MJ03_9FIRM|nr:TM1802 family CRISPR-associated protein [Desulforamulus profundi]PHJ39533.1 CRISPR-associated protein [Desulforamulus profundi]
MKLDFLAKFADPVMQTPAGQGAFLAGVVLGMVARGQTKDGSIDGAPLFKQMTFGRMKRRDLKRHLARVPELVKAYDLNYKDLIRKLAAYAGELILQDEGFELGVDGNFAFATAFMNAREYFWTIFGKQHGENDEGN